LASFGFFECFLGCRATDAAFLALDFEVFAEFFLVER
jgi:hypothetical protein